ncbi:MAG: serine hydrolase [Bacteroidota bacterium]
MRRSIFSLLFILSFLGLQAQTGIDVPGMSSCDILVNQFMNTYDIPGLSFALSKNGKMVYMRSFGHADLARTEETQPHHMFRIASVSKPITSIAVNKLIEDGLLNYNDKVFGTDGILANHPELSLANVSDNRIFDITVRNLLEHTGGWDRSVDCTPSPSPPYSYDPNNCDPISFPLYVSNSLGTSNPVSEGSLIRFLMEYGVDFTPGTQFAYSNIGYLALGLVIEEISGKPYEQYVKDRLLTPIGIHDMYIGKNLLVDKREREAEYQGNGFNNLSIYGDGSLVPWEYGGWNLEAMDAHGGWIASARDLVRLLVAVDGFTSKPDIINALSRTNMTTPGQHAPNYAQGWSVNSAGNWWHTGALDGTASIWARTSGGYTWAIILNKRIIDSNSNNFWAALDGLPWNCISQTSSFPTHDLLEVPDENGKDMFFSGDGSNSLTVSWTPGDGDKRILLVKEGSAVSEFPLDGVDYGMNTSFGQGDDLGNGNFVAYDGDGNSVNITGLDPSKTYHFKLYEYNKNAATGNHSLYQLFEPPTEEATTATSTNLLDLIQQGIRFYPNPTQAKLKIEMEDPRSANLVELYDLQGHLLKRMKLTSSYEEFSLEELSPQLYVLRFKKDDAFIGHAKLYKF